MVTIARRAAPLTICALLLLTALVSAGVWPGGLLASDLPGDRGTVDSGPSPGPRFGGTYLCPPGGDLPLSGGICSQRFSGLFDYLGEPDLFISPVDPQVMAFAANAGQSVDALTPLLRATPHLDVQKFAFFTTANGATTWDRAELPPPPPADPPRSSAVTRVEFWDPTIAFDATGTLHVVGIIVWQEPDGAAKLKRVFHLTTDDLGETWSDYTLFGVRVDRPWMTIHDSGEIDLVWWEARGTLLSFVRSVDDGRTWVPLSPDAPEIPCYFPSPPVKHDGETVIACARDERFATDPTIPQTGIYRYDPVLNEFWLAGELGPTSWPFLFTPTDGSLVLIGGMFGISDVLISRSTDGGATWASLPDLGDRLASAEEWSFLQFMGGRADPWGNIHIFVRGIDLPPRPEIGEFGPYVDLPMWLAAAYADHFAVAHVVLDPATGDIRSERSLTPLVSESVGAGVSRAGDVYSIGFTDEKAVLVWEHHRSLYLTFWMP